MNVKPLNLANINNKPDLETVINIDLDNKKDRIIELTSSEGQPNSEQPVDNAQQFLHVKQPGPLKWRDNEGQFELRLSSRS